MPNDFYSLDASFPQFTGQESEKQRVGAIYDYLIQLQQTLRYCLQNLGSDNFNDTELETIGNTIREPLAIKLSGVEGTIADLKLTAEGLDTQVGNAEGEVTKLSQKVDSFTLSVSNGKDSSTIKLMAGDAVISSQNIKFEGVVTFTSGDDGYAIIDGGKVRCDKLQVEEGFFTYSLWLENSDNRNFTRLNEFGVHIGNNDVSGGYIGSVVSSGDALSITAYTGNIQIGGDGQMVNLNGNVYVNGKLIS